jgi:outer membrane receptor protein involved in Fe transport
MIANNFWRWAWSLAVASVLSSAPAVAQDDPFADEPEGDTPAEDPDAGTAAEPPAEPETPLPAPEPAPAEPSANAEAAATLSTETELALGATATPVDGAEAAPAPAAPPPVVTGTHLPRPRLVVDGALIVDSPLRTETQGREYLQSRRQLSGVAMPDVAAALRFGGAGTNRLELRLQPTLVLMNGRRLVSAPFFGPNGSDFVDINQIPIQLIDRTEVTSGHAAGLYGENAMGGVINFVTRRDIEGIDIEVGGQATDKFDQGEADVAVMLGTGKGKTGANLLLSYFNRQPLAATDRDWIGDRTDRVESLFGQPGTYQQLSFFDYPISDPFCPIAENYGHSTGYEVRLRGYGPPSNLNDLTQEQQELFLNGYDMVRGLTADRNDDDIDPLQSPTFCAADYTGSNDLILKDERLQVYTTFWHGLTDHTEVYGEAGYYRNENENRTAAAFPLIRVASSVEHDRRLIVPSTHPDQPSEYYGFSSSEGQEVPNDLFVIGRTQGTFNGDAINERRVDVLRGVLGIKGDLKGIAPNSILGTWDWDVAGTYTTSELVARVNDTLLDKLQFALDSCPATKRSSDTGMQVPTTIKERQNAGCFNPFYSSVVNSAALNPAGVNTQTAQASRAGFITGDTDPPSAAVGYGVQDGGYICDPNDPDSPACPMVDLNGDGTVDPWPAGQPNTQQVIDSFTGEHFEIQQRSLAMVDAGIRGDLVDFGDGEIGLALGSQYRRESLMISYDQAYNERLYGFIFGGDDIAPVTRDVIAGNLEMRIRLAGGVVELQPAARIEAYDTVGVGLNGLLGVSLRPFAQSDSEALEYLGLRGHVGYGQQPPTLTQLYGQLNEFTQVDYRGGTSFLPHQVSGNTDLDFEKYTTVSGGPQWDFAGIHVAADFWMTFIDDMITSDNSRTLVSDCRAQFVSGNGNCDELVFLSLSDTISHIESRFENIAAVDTNGVDGSISYTLDTKRRGLGDFGTFMVGVQGTYINSYLIQGSRVLAPYYREHDDGRAAPLLSTPASIEDLGDPTVPPEGKYLQPDFVNGERNYDTLTAEYDAAGFRNFENFAPPIPKLRFAIPVRWTYSGHTLGATVRFIDGYNDDSEYTVERQDLPGINQLQYANGEEIPSWTVLDALYSLEFGSDAWKGAVTIGVINLLDADPPAVESPLGYEVGLHDPRGRTLYARLSGDF